MIFVVAQPHKLGMIGLIDFRKRMSYHIVLFRLVDEYSLHLCTLNQIQMHRRLLISHGCDQLYHWIKKNIFIDKELKNQLIYTHMVGCFYNDFCCDFPFFVLHDERMYGDILVVEEIRILPRNHPGIGNFILINETKVDCHKMYWGNKTRLTFKVFKLHCFLTMRKQSFNLQIFCFYATVL